MNVRLTILLAVLAVMIGSTWAIIEFTNLVSRGESDPDEPWLYHIEETDITRIEVVHNDNAALYSRDAGSHQWMIEGDPSFPVFHDRWAGTTLLLSGPRVNRGLKQTIDDPAQYGLDPPESIVRVTDWAGNTFEFHMGIPTPDGQNQYTRLVGDNALYTVPAIWSQVVNRLADDPPFGRLFDLDPEAITVIEVNAGDDAAVYFMDGGRWWVYPGPSPVVPELSGPVSDEWATWLEVLTAPRIDTIVDQRLQDRDAERVEEYGFLPPSVRVVIARRGMSTVEIHLAEGPAGSDSYYARSVNATDERVYSIGKFRLAGIESLASEPLTDPDWEPPEDSEETEGDSTDN